MAMSMLSRSGAILATCGAAIAFREKPIVASGATNLEILSSPLHSGCTRWYTLVRPIIFCVPPETAHVCVLKCGAILGSIASSYNLVQRGLTCVVNRFAGLLVGEKARIFLKRKDTFSFCGIPFESPIGVSAGFDKNGKLINFFATSSFIGHAEIGSVSYLPWLGNPQPRLFRLVEDKAIINRMGLNNDGAVVVANRLSEQKTKRCPIGVNITKTPSSEIFGKDAVDDFLTCFNFFKNMTHIDWITLNVSCPNTAEGKTFEDPDALAELLAAIQAERPAYSPLLLLKLAPPTSPDWKEKTQKLIRIAKKHGVNGLIIANTMPGRPSGLKSDPALVQERGGLSGPPIFGTSLPLIELAVQEGMPVVASGGISSGKDAFDMLQAGASLIQIYTAMVYEGPGIFADISNGLRRLMIVNNFV